MKKLFILLSLLISATSFPAAAPEHTIESLDEEEELLSTAEQLNSMAVGAWRSTYPKPALESKEEEHGLSDQKDKEPITLIIEPVSKKIPSSAQKLTLPRRLINYSPVLKASLENKGETQIIFQPGQLKSITLQSLGDLLTLIDKNKYNKIDLKLAVKQYFDSLSMDQFIDWLYIQFYLDIPYIKEHLIKFAAIRIQKECENELTFSQFLKGSFKNFKQLPKPLLQDVIRTTLLGSPVLKIITSALGKNWKPKEQSIVDKKTRDLIQPGHQPRVFISDDGKIFAQLKNYLPADDKNIIEIVNSKTLDTIQTITLNNCNFFQMAISPNNRLLTVSYYQSTDQVITLKLAIYNIKTGKLLANPENTMVRFFINFDQSNTYIALIYGIESIKIFNTTDFQLVKEFALQPKVNIKQIAFSKDSTTIAALLETGQIYIWDIATGVQKTLNTQPETTAFNFGMTNNHLLVAAKNNLSLWDIEKQTKIFDYQAIHERISITGISLLEHYGIIATTADFPVLTLYTLHNKRVATQFDLTSPSKLIANRTATVFLKDYYLLDFNPFYKSILELIDNLTLFQAIYLLVWNNFNIKISNEFIQFIDSLPQPLKEYLKTPMQKELDEYLVSQKKSFWGSFFGKK